MFNRYVTCLNDLINRDLIYFNGNMNHYIISSNLILRKSLSIDNETILIGFLTHSSLNRMSLKFLKKTLGLI